MPYDVALLATVPATLSRASSGHSPHRDEPLTRPLIRAASDDLIDQLLGKAKHMCRSLRGNGKHFRSGLGV
jgi:hypothetical protein